MKFNHKNMRVFLAGLALVLGGMSGLEAKQREIQLRQQAAAKRSFFSMPEFLKSKERKVREASEAVARRAAALESGKAKIRGIGSRVVAKNAMKRTALQTGVAALGRESLAKKSAQEALVKNLATKTTAEQHLFSEAKMTSRLHKSHHADYAEAKHSLTYANNALAAHKSGVKPLKPFEVKHFNGLITQGTKAMTALKMQTLLHPSVTPAERKAAVDHGLIALPDKDARTHHLLTKVGIGTATLPNRLADQLQIDKRMVKDVEATKGMTRPEQVKYEKTVQAKRELKEANAIAAEKRRTGFR